MSLSSTDGHSQLTFEFQRFNLDALFSTDDRNRLRNWIDEARLLLVDILRRDHIQIIYMRYNIYHGFYDQLTPSVTTSRCLELLDNLDVICESTGIIFLPVVLAHEITHGINMRRVINNDAGGIQKSTPKLIIFRSYSDGTDIDAGNSTKLYY
ncbi:unnamed protein product [Adineta steineri]|uniref:Uncharacterized protein n=1 Tax=Adineta steineri TaxID=433720 RepID=A0A820EHV1_9BILA|nr:unnamed protein product [Adineta steineri]